MEHKTGPLPEKLPSPPYQKWIHKSVLAWALIAIVVGVVFLLDVSGDPVTILLGGAALMLGLVCAVASLYNLLFK